MQFSDLKNGDFTIPARHFRVKNSSEVRTLAGKEKMSIKSFLPTEYSSVFDISVPQVFLQKSMDRDDLGGFVGKYSIEPSFEVLINAYQGVGEYEGTITLTVSEDCTDVDL